MRFPSLARHVRPAAAPDAASLPHALRTIAVREVPASFYLVVQLATPLAAWTWGIGLHRFTGWLVAASAFGAWALCEQRLAREDFWHLQGFDSARWLVAALRATRFVAGFAAGALVVALASEAFIQLLSRVTGLAGIAG